MKTKTIRVSVDLLQALERKLIADGKPAGMVPGHLGFYVNEILWGWVGGKTMTLPKIVTKVEHGELPKELEKGHSGRLPSSRTRVSDHRKSA